MSDERRDGRETAAASDTSADLNEAGAGDQGSGGTGADDIRFVEGPPPSRLAKFRLDEQLIMLDESLKPENGRRWPNRGRPVAFPQLSAALDGFRNYLYVFAGGSRMGKSCMLLQLAYDLCRLHEDARCVVLSLDQSVRDVQVRLVGLAGQCNMDFLVAPTPEGEETYGEKKRKGLEAVGRLKDRLFLVDESEGAIDLGEIRRMVEELRAEDPDGPLYLVVDPIYKVRCDLPLSADMDTRTGHLAAELKALALEHRVGVLASTRLQRAAGAERPELKDLEGQASLLYEAAAVMLLYCDAVNDPNTPFLEWEWGTDDLMVPIFELELAKNKMGPAVGRLFYRFYQTFSRFKECSELEVDNFRRMLTNLRQHAGLEEDQGGAGLPTVEDVTRALPGE